MTAMRTGRLLAAAPRGLAEERFETILSRDDIRFERIVSAGQTSPPGFWCDQKEDEFVLLLAGAATLRIDGQDNLLDLEPGDWVELPARCRHRVEWTQPDPPTVWLAVFLPPRSSEA